MKERGLGMGVYVSQKVEGYILLAYYKCLFGARCYLILLLERRDAFPSIASIYRGSRVFSMLLCYPLSESFFDGSW